MNKPHIPFEIQEEIIKRIRDVKSLIRFRLVSKPWNSFICSSKFITDYHVTHPQPRHHLLVRYDDGVYSSQLEYVSIADDITFPRQEDMPSPRVGRTSRLVGSSQGLICLYDSNTTAVVWNPSIRKSVDIVVPNVLKFEPYVLEFCYGTAVGFGVCPHTSDPMLVKINYIFPSHWMNIDYNSISIPWQVEVFKLSSGAWRSPSCSSNLPRKSLTFVANQVCVDGFIYWRARHNSLGDYPTLILSFDMKSEEFTEICLPNSLATHTNLYLSKLKESLVVIESEVVGGCGVWMMEHADPKSFTKLYTIKAPDYDSIHVHGSIHVLGFRNRGQPIIGIGMTTLPVNAFRDDIGPYSLTPNFPTGKFFVYEPASEYFRYIWIESHKDNCFVSPYMETLLLLDH